MKILIVEDDCEKCKAIKSAIQKVPYDFRIDTTQNVFSAKNFLSKSYYDLLILDLNLPLEEGGECDRDSGYNLLIEIQKVRLYKKPGSILIVTSYEDLHDKYKEEIDQGLFKIIKYTTFDITWEKEIIEYTNYLVSSNDDSNDITETGYNYDVAILSAVEIENSQILNELSNNESFKIKGDPTYYTKGLFTKGKKKIKVVTATQHQMGIAASATLTLKMIKNFKPKYICMAGIAAGKKGEGNFGDIIIPTEVWDYGSGKITEKDEKTSAETNDFLFKPDPKYLSLDVELKELLNKNFRPILDTIKNDWKSIKPDSSLNIIKGPMACGSIVVQDESIIEKYIDPHNRKLKGLDMESYGVFYAAENSFMPKPKVLVCKSICDFADTHKDDKYQSYAAFTSIRFLKHLILEELL